MIFEKQSAQKTAQAHRHEDSCGDTGQHDAKALTHHQPQDRAASSGECHAEPELLHPLRDDVRHQSGRGDKRHNHGESIEDCK